MRSSPVTTKTTAAVRTTLKKVRQMERWPRGWPMDESRVTAYTEEEMSH